MDRVDLVVHVEDFALVESERFDDVVEGVGVDRFFKRLDGGDTGALLGW